MEQLLIGPSRHTNGTANLMGALRRDGIRPATQSSKTSRKLKSTSLKPTRDDAHLLKTALKPRWIGFFAADLAVASVFVLLTKWQFEQSTSNQPRTHEVTETPVELTDHFQPGVPMMSDQADQMVTFTGQLDPHKSVQVESRLHDGVQGLLAGVQRQRTRRCRQQPDSRGVGLDCRKSKPPATSSPTI